MKKWLKILLYSLLGCVGLVFLYVMIRFANSIANLGGEPRYINKNASDYIDENASDVKPIQLGNAAEFNGDLYYIDTNEHLLYKRNSSGQNIKISDSQMDGMILVDNYIVYSFNDALMSQNRTTGEVIKIGRLKEYAINEPVYADGKLLYIDDKDCLRSYDLTNRQSNILSNNTYEFTVYGHYIFYQLSIDDFFGSGCFEGIFAMDMNGQHSSRLTDAYAWDIEIFENYLYLVNDYYQIYRVDMQNSTYITFPQYNYGIDFQLGNDKTYYTTSEDKNGDGYSENVFIETDLDGGFIRELQTFEYEGECWLESTDQYLYMIIVDSSGDSMIRIFDEPGNVVDEIIYEDSRIEEFVCLPDYIVVRLTRDDEVVSYVYNTAFQELGSF